MPAKDNSFLCSSVVTLIRFFTLVHRRPVPRVFWWKLFKNIAIVFALSSDVCERGDNSLFFFFLFSISFYDPVLFRRFCFVSGFGISKFRDTFFFLRISFQ